VHRLGDRLDRLEVTLRRDGKAGLDDVDAQARELVGDLEFLGDVERDARRLLAVTQGRVEDQYSVHLVRLPGLRSMQRKQQKTLRPEGSEGTREHRGVLAPK